MKTKRLTFSILIAAIAGLSHVAMAQETVFGETPPFRTYNLKDMGKYDEEKGYGFDFNTSPTKDGSEPFYFSVKVPDGNYKVTLKLGDRKRNAETTVRAESRRLMLDRVATKKGEATTLTIMVHKRTPDIDGKNVVKINPREVGTPTWDDKLTLEFTGSAPAVESVTIQPITEADSITTIYLCGNSTVVDQTYEPWASWGQIIPAFFDENIVVANNAESGEKTSSFISRKRLDKVLSMAKPGDWIFMEFGHNDEKDKGPGSGAWYNYTTNLKTFIDRARKAGLNPVLLTPTARRKFDENGQLKWTHGEYPEAMRVVAHRENVPLIDLNPMTRTLFEALGPEDSKKALVHYPAGQFPGQTEAFADDTHFNPYGATQVAKCVIEGIRQNIPQLASHIILQESYDPSHPDDFNSFVWTLAPVYDFEKPYGN